MTTFTSEDRESVMNMNANELAKIVDAWAVKESAECLSKAATMLRKQQEEIEYWKEMFEKAMKEQEK